MAAPPLLLRAALLTVLAASLGLVQTDLPCPSTYLPTIKTHDGDILPPPIWPVKTDDEVIHSVASAPVLVAKQSTNESTLWFPLVQHLLGGDPSKIMLRAQTSADMNFGNTDAVFFSITYGRSWKRVEVGPHEPVQKRMCYTYPIDDAYAPTAAALASVGIAAAEVETGTLCIPYGFAVKQNPMSAACKAKLNSACNNASLEGSPYEVSCVAADKKSYGRSMGPYFALDLPLGDGIVAPKSTWPYIAWRCYSHEALNANNTAWSNKSKTPEAYCHGHAGPNTTVNSNGIGWLAQECCAFSPENSPVHWHTATRNGSLWLVLKNGTVAKTRDDAIPVTFRAPGNVFTVGSTILVEDGTLLSGVYSGGDMPDNIQLYQSQPPYVNWTRRSRVTPDCPAHPAAVGELPNCQVGNENWIVRLPDKRILLVFRGWNIAPSSHTGQLAITVSTDVGYTWSTPAAMQGPGGNHNETWQKQHPGVPSALVNMYAPHAVEPNIIVLENGVVALTSGRPGQFLWTVHVDDLVPGNESLAEWGFFNIFEAHNAAAKAGLFPTAWVYPEACANGTAPCPSTSYASITAVPSPNSSIATVVISYDGSFDTHRIFSTRIDVMVGNRPIPFQTDDVDSG
jgi:hypothetical protein